MNTTNTPSTKTELQAFEWGFRAGMCAAAACVLNTHGNFKSAVEILSAAGVDADDIKAAGLTPANSRLLQQALLAVD